MTTDVTTRFDELAIAREEFDDSLRASNRAPLTRKSYLLALNQFRDFAMAQGMPTDLRAIRREHIEAFLNHMTEGGAKPATVAQRFRSLQQFWKWALETDN